MEPKKGDGQFQWSTGGWFGAQVGSTVWIAVAGVILLWKSCVLTGCVFLGSFLAPNIIGLVLWSKRDRIRPYPAIQWLIVIIGVFTVVSLVCLDISAKIQLVSPQYEQFPRAMYLLLLMFPALMVMFHFQNKQTGKKSQ